MKNLIGFLTVIALTSCSYAQILPLAPEWKATVKVVDETAQPVPDASVTIGYYVPPPAGETIAMAKKTGQTDTNGIFRASEHSRSSDLEFYVQKEGYYPSFQRYELGHPAQYNAAKWSPNLTLILKKIGQPIPMYVKDAEIKFPKENEPLGFDLEIGDWVVPFGTGKQADFLFTLHRKIVSSRDYEADLKLTFPNPGDGIVVVPSAPDTGSALLMDHNAPESGYISERLWHYSQKPSGKPVGIFEKPEPVLGYYFRVRTILDEKGNVKNALYGKIPGDIKVYVGAKAPQAGAGFIYYLNPTANSRNVEFDPKQNLFKNLPFDQRLKKP